VKKVSDFCLRHEAALAAALLLLGLLLRTLGLGRFPPGLNQDEASIGYDAWSLLVSGMDRNGDRWPVLFTSWGSGQNVLYAYLSLPFLKLLGLSAASLRLCAGFWGSVCLLAFWRLARRVSRGFGLAALTGLTLNPWHLTVSRWALESNLLPVFLLLGVWALAAAAEKPKWLLLAAALFALSLYAYGTAFLLLPVFLLLCSIRLLRKKTVRFPLWLASLGVFVLIALPLALCQLRNALGLPEMKLLWMTLPRLTETRQAATVSFSPEHLRELLRLLWTQSDGLIWNSCGRFGLFYGLPGLLFVLAGLAESLYRCFRSELRNEERWMLYLLLSGMLAALFININVNRVNFLFLPLVWLQARGLYLCVRLFPRVGAVCFAVLVCAAVFLIRFYVTDYADALGPAFYDGLTQAIAYAETLEPEALWVTGDVNMPYIYVLFTEKTPAETFQNTVRYWNPDGAFRWVLSFDRYRFYGEPPAGLCILPVDEAETGRILQQFGGYAVVENP